MPELPWKLGKKKPYEKQEARTAKKPGAKAQVNSGRVWSALRDVKRTVRGKTYLYDNKTTSSHRYTLSLEEFQILKRDANRTPPGCIPVLQIDFQNGERLVSLVVVEESVFDDLLVGR